MDARPEIDAESTQGDILKEPQGHVRFENVHFRYPTRPGVRVLRDLNLEVKPGTYIALVGPSGCGKSTTYVSSVAFISAVLMHSHYAVSSSSSVFMIR